MPFSVLGFTASGALKCGRTVRQRLDSENNFSKTELSLSLISSLLSDTDPNRWEGREQVTGSDANSAPTWLDLIRTFKTSVKEDVWRVKHEKEMLTCLKL